jgi:hypothetical protein
LPGGPPCPAVPCPEIFRRCQTPQARRAVHTNTHAARTRTRTHEPRRSVPCSTVITTFPTPQARARVNLSPGRAAGGRTGPQSGKANRTPEIFRRCHAPQVRVNLSPGRAAGRRTGPQRFFVAATPLRSGEPHGVRSGRVGVLGVPVQGETLIMTLRTPRRVAGDEPHQDHHSRALIA